MFITEEEIAQNKDKFLAARDAIDKVLELFECKSPAGGLGPGTHCAACCYGTGLLIENEEDDVLVKALMEARRELHKAWAV